MTDYQGEFVRITLAAPTKWNGQVMTDADVVGVFVTVENATGATILDDREMTYSADEALWYYLWTTTEDETPTRGGGTALPSGSYKGAVTLVDLDLHESVEELRIRLNRRRV